MNKIKVIITGATGMVGEGVLLHCLESNEVAEILVVTRRAINIQHPKLKEIIVKDFNNLGEAAKDMANYDACFFCAGISSIGLSETEYTHITYVTTLNFARVLLSVNPNMVFNFVSGSHTNANGKQMWQRVKGKTEDELMNLGFKGQYNFRPGFMKPVAGQKNVKWFLKPLNAIFPIMLPKYALTLHQVGQAMINSTVKDYNKQVLEIQDIKILSKA